MGDLGPPCEEGHLFRGAQQGLEGVKKPAQGGASGSH